MAPPPRFRALESPTGAPAWLPALLRPLNEALGQLHHALSRRLTRQENLAAGDREISWKGGTTTFAVDTAVVPRPRHVWVDKLFQADGQAPAVAWSFTWHLLPSGEVELYFQGLDDTVDYTANVAWE